MAQDDPYALLQVVPTADLVVIRAAYRALAQTHHPDAGGSEQRMADLNQAWAALGDPMARAAYDRERAVTANQAADAVAIVSPPPDPQQSPGAPTKTLDFGRYQGWTLVQLAQTDPDYLRWLARTPAGRGLHADIEEVLGKPSPAPDLRSAFGPRPAHAR